MLDESICYFRSAGSILSFYSIFDENPVGKQCRPRSDAHDVLSDLRLHCWRMTVFTGFHVIMG